MGYTFIFVTLIAQSACVPPSFAFGFGFGVGNERLENTKRRNALMTHRGRKKTTTNRRLCVSTSGVLHTAAENKRRWEFNSLKSCR